jgi:hypothetical protein
MASSPGIAKPGSEYGPCLSECKHRDCAASRTMVVIVCRICNQRIGYETRFYFEDNNLPVHGLCLDEENE